MLSFCEARECDDGIRVGMRSRGVRMRVKYISKLL